MTDTPKQPSRSLKLEQRRAWARTLQVVPSETPAGLPQRIAPQDLDRFERDRSKITRQLERERGEPVGDPMTADEARVLTDRIKRDVAAVADLIQSAYLGRAWAALGYESWDVYCIQEF